MAATMSEGVRTVLLYVLGLLVVILGGLVAVALVLRRRQVGHPAAEARGTRRADMTDARSASEAWAGSAGGLQDPMACPACRREFEAALRYCPHDAAELVPAPQMLAHMRDRRRKSAVCPRCRRAYEGKVRFCPHDGTDLIPMGLHLAAHDAADHDDAACTEAKICPECQGRYDYAATFCGKDGVELVVLN